MFNSPMIIIGGAGLQSPDLINQCYFLVNFTTTSNKMSRYIIINEVEVIIDDNSKTSAQSLVKFKCDISF